MSSADGRECVVSWNAQQLYRRIETRHGAPVLPRETRVDWRSQEATPDESYLGPAVDLSAQDRGVIRQTCKERLAPGRLRRLRDKVGDALTGGGRIPHGPAGWVACESIVLGREAGRSSNLNLKLSVRSVLRDHKRPPNQDGTQDGSTEWAEPYVHALTIASRSAPDSERDSRTACA